MIAEVNIKPDMLTWAIRRAGYDLDEFVTTTFPRVGEWLSEKKKPTVRQLEEFSHKVHLPFGYLLLPEPPVEKIPIPFFRTGKTPAIQVSLNVYETILLLQRRQEWLVEYLKETGMEPLDFVGRFNIQHSPGEIANDIKRQLHLDDQWADRFPNWEQAKAHLTSQIEEAGIVVSFNSIVENNSHRKIAVNECRGFVLVDKLAPFMFVNSADSKAAQMFTLVHELAHIWVGKSAGFDFQQMLPADDPVEICCDQVAAEFLVPAHLFAQTWTDETQDFKIIARKFKVSPIVVGRRALDLGYISKNEFFSFYNAYVQNVDFKKAATKSGGDYYAIQKNRLSLRFMSHLHQALKEGKILYRDVYQLTGLKGDTYQNFVQHQHL